jgi:hypothetical protein
LVNKLNYYFKIIFQTNHFLIPFVRDYTIFIKPIKQIHGIISLEEHLSRKGVKQINGYSAGLIKRYTSAKNGKGKSEI